MQVLFVHNNLPGQFVHLMKRLALNPEISVRGIGSNTSKPMENVKIERYSIAGGGVSSVHPFARRFELECRRAEQVLYAAASIKADGFQPDFIFTHPGWGEALPLREVFPDAKIVCYCEYYYGSGSDVGFDPEFPTFGMDGRVSVSLKNAATLLALHQADIGLAPTEWQRSRFPRELQSKIEVIHDGIAVDNFISGDNDSVTLAGKVFRPGDEVITYVSRNLEPYRGYHVVMRALVPILKARPKAHVIIVGNDGVSYGARPPRGQTWKNIFLDEVKHDLPLDRVYFVGRVSYKDYQSILKVSALHLYMTYPFVLSWSLLEAMAAGCLVIASDTAPVREVIKPEKNGILVPFFDREALASRAVEALRYPKRFSALRNGARETIRREYDFDTVVLPRLQRLMMDLRSDQIVTQAS